MPDLDDFLGKEVNRNRKEKPAEATLDLDPVIHNLPPVDERNNRTHYQLLQLAEKVLQELEYEAGNSCWSNCDPACSCGILTTIAELRAKHGKLTPGDNIISPE